MPYHAWRISINIIIQTDDTNPVGLLLYYKYSASHPTDWFDVWTKAEPWVMTHPHKIKKIYFLLEKEKHNASHIGLHAVWSDQLYKCMSAKKIYTSGQIIAYMLCTSHVLNLPDISF